MRNLLLLASTSVLLCGFLDMNSAYYHRKFQLSSSMRNQLFAQSEAASNQNNKSTVPSSLNSKLSSVPIDDKAQMTRLLSMKPNAAGYTRIDESFLDDSVKDLFKLSDHALHDTLNGPGMVEVYEVFKKNDSEEIVCLIKFGKSLNGYPGIVHGGITALLFDNTFGWAFLALKAPHGVTANLNINYRCVHLNTISILYCVDCALTELLSICVCADAR